MTMDEEKQPHQPEILVVDDTPDNLQLLTSILTGHGYRVRPATGGLLALRSVAAKAPDLILLDVKMPDLNGFEVCHRLKAEEQTRNIPVLFVSALSDKVAKAKGFEAGGLDYISSPFETEEVLARVGIHLRLRELTECLEKKVRERTEELARANLQLQEEINERKRAEEALTVEATRRRILVEGARDGIVVLDQQGRVYEANRRFAQMLGYSADEIRQKHVWDWDGQWTREQLLEAIRLLGPAGDHFETCHRHKDGSVLEVEVSTNGAELGGQKLVFCVCRDITERKRAEEALHASKERLALAQRAAGAGVWDWDIVTGRIEWSLELFDLFGLDSEHSEAGFEAWRKLLHPEDRALAVDRMDYAVKEGTPLASEYRVVLSDGGFRWINALGNTIYDQDRRPLRMSGICLDITARRLAEATLRLDSEIMANMADGVFLIRASDGIIVHTNDQFEKMFGYGPGELIGKKVSIVNAFTDKNPEAMPNEIMDVLNRTKVWAGEVNNLKKDGTNFWCSARVTTFEHDSYGTVWVAVHRDITERKSVEAEMAKLETQNRQLQKSESLGRMAGAVAHHFNNQLQAVMMNLEMAMKDPHRDAGPVENLTQAMQSARKAAEVSRLMLAYLGQTDAKREPLDLSDACQRHLPMLRGGMPQTVVLENDLPSPGPTIDGNANQIQQVLNNLVTNASEAMGDVRGIVRLTVKTVSTADIPVARRFPSDSKLTGPAYACLEVADVGCGIEAGTIEKLFDPFYSSKFTGRGMGLPVVLGIVRAHHGVVTVESEPGLGSVFRVFLPILTEAAPQKPVPMAQAPQTAGSGTVLVVDDEKSLRMALTAALKGLGFAVLAAKDGVEALEIFQQHRDEIRGVLCDLSMPRMNGWETLAALRQLAPGLPVILSSGYGEAQMMAGEHPEQPQAFLSKPYEYEELIGAIRQVLAK